MNPTFRLKTLDKLKIIKRVDKTLIFLEIRAVREYEYIPKKAGTEVFDFEALSAKKQAGDLNKLAQNAADLAENSPDLEEFYKLFYHYDYAIRKLLPSLYTAYKIDPDKDLKKDF